ncbi:MAG: hypothetical protein Q7T86_19425 [Hyphomicrobiaceae bacterium]|nr:hypothetical protein [Hyphomicrobiaceae bacterium]
MFRRLFLASSFIVLGAFVIAADAHAQSIGLPPASNGSGVRTLPNPNTPRPSVQTQTYTVPGSTLPNALGGGPRQPQSDFGRHGPYVGMKWVGNQ